MLQHLMQQEVLSLAQIVSKYIHDKISCTQTIRRESTLWFKTNERGFKINAYQGFDSKRACLEANPFVLMLTTVWVSLTSSETIGTVMKM